MSILSFLVNLLSLYLFHGVKKKDKNQSEVKQVKRSLDCGHSHQQKAHSHSNCKHLMRHGSTEKIVKFVGGENIFCFDFCWHSL